MPTRSTCNPKGLSSKEKGILTVLAFWAVAIPVIVGFVIAPMIMLNLTVIVVLFTAAFLLSWAIYIEVNPPYMVEPPVVEGKKSNYYKMINLNGTWNIYSLKDQYLLAENIKSEEKADQLIKALSLFAGEKE